MLKERGLCIIHSKTMNLGFKMPHEYLFVMIMRAAANRCEQNRQ